MNASIEEANRLNYITFCLPFHCDWPPKTACQFQPDVLETLELRLKLRRTNIAARGGEAGAVQRLRTNSGMHDDGVTHKWIIFHYLHKDMRFKCLPLHKFHNFITNKQISTEIVMQMNRIKIYLSQNEWMYEWMGSKLKTWSI